VLRARGFAACLLSGRPPTLGWCDVLPV
jgi:hypothetical protein